jgi:putative spermidine/putrescine transport system substrate-binding protein
MSKRLGFYLSLFLFIGMVISQVAFAQQKLPYAGQTLRVATWGGAWVDIRKVLIGQQLEKVTGAKIEWVLGNPSDHLAKLIAAKGGELPFDLAEMGPIETVQARKLGFLEKIDRSLVPNIKKVTDAELFSDDSVADYVIEFVYAYLPSKFKELGLPPPARLKDLFNPKLANKIALPLLGASTPSPRFMVSLAIEEGGSINDIKPALDRLKEAKVSYYYRATTELEMRMLSGEIWAAYMVVSRPFLHTLAGRDMDYASVGPGTKKATGSAETIVIVKDTKHKELAHMYLNNALSLDAQYGMTEWGGMRPVTDEGLKKVLNSSNAKVRRIGEIPWKDIFTIDFPPDIDIVAANLAKWVAEFNREVGVR